MKSWPRRLHFLGPFSPPLISLVLVLNISASLSSFGAQLTVAAASDLAPAAPELRAAFEQASGHKVNWINGSSGMLARQVEAGAPYDVLLSADENIVRKLATGGDVQAASLRIYARGRLALWKKGGGATLADLESPRVRFIAIANPAHAPYGQAARDFLMRRGAWERLRPKLVYGESVLQAYQMAASGNADLALVALPQVIGQGGLALDPAAFLALRQTGAIPKHAAEPAAARQFLDFLTGPKGQAILARFGFLQP